ncbi:hypothetical protein ERO13_D12G094266v2 [Gossypium hirsutum]|uniref:Uncharacterized protein isoform X2 n=2 Tax=Gossypium TaxID=3633 RepID=A0ABM3B9T9_GOSHI|nr:uncharacterized protein LOC107945520 isoform X2 [Gossypium hirsutum]XP_040963818.1 uncharacterized protein LOC107945520 isoform X2 [Gossypium hirsutum]KAG4115292.1 hypothetical protein ERO13_D12G094266v2 [Gossypium hirsutum]TYI50501.1 hypothetical protein E1A91_D12G105100v1 [Gossypium mustelinum]
MPVHTVESIVLSIISMLSSPNDESPANVEAVNDDLVENLLGDFEYEVQDKYLLYRNASQEINEGHSIESDSVKSEAEANQVDVLNTLDTGSSALDEILSVEAEKVDNGRDEGGQQQKEVRTVRVEKRINNSYPT